MTNPTEPRTAAGRRHVAKLDAISASPLSDVSFPDAVDDVLDIEAEASAEPAALREALDDLFDDYLAAHGPDGYPEPMPQSWRVVRDWLEAGDPAWPALAREEATSE